MRKSLNEAASGGPQPDESVIGAAMVTVLRPAAGAVVAAGALVGATVGAATAVVGALVGAAAAGVLVAAATGAVVAAGAAVGVAAAPQAVTSQSMAKPRHSGNRCFFLPNIDSSLSNDWKSVCETGVFAVRG